jgi:rRNA-processing protein FCF1
MLVTLHPSANRHDVLEVLTGIRAEADNAMGPGNIGVAGRLIDYLEWAAESARMLHNCIKDADIDRLIFTRGYDRLLAACGSLTSTDTGTQRMLNSLINMEVRLRTEALDEIIMGLRSPNPQWAADDLYAVLDTSVYIEHDNKLEKLDIAPALTAFPDKRLHLLVPMIVIDELDVIKNKGEDVKRWRAAYTLGVLERIFSPTQVRRGVLRDGEYGVRGAVDVEILYEPPGHVRLPVNDDEIIDRTLAASPLAPKPVTLVTFDTGQTFRAREADVPVVKLTKPLGDEPVPRQKRLKAEHRQEPTTA